MDNDRGQRYPTAPKYLQRRCVCDEFRISIDQDTSSDIQSTITYKAMRYVKDRSILYTSNAI